MAERLCKVCGGWHNLDLPWPSNCRPEAPLTSDFPRPMMIRDHLDDLWSPIDGKRYSSKSAYYRAVKAKGYEIAGNDKSVTEAHLKPKTVATPGGLKDELQKAWHQHT